MEYIQSIANDSIRHIHFLTYIQIICSNGCRCARMDPGANASIESLRLSMSRRIRLRPIGFTSRTVPSKAVKFTPSQYLRPFHAKRIFCCSVQRCFACVSRSEFSSKGRVNRFLRRILFRWRIESIAIRPRRPSRSVH